MMGLAGLLGTVELKSRWSVCLWLFVPPEHPQRASVRAAASLLVAPGQAARLNPPSCVVAWVAGYPHLASRPPGFPSEAYAYCTPLGPREAGLLWSARPTGTGHGSGGGGTSDPDEFVPPFAGRGLPIGALSSPCA